jgi:signal transduction histidine kinase
MAGTLLGSLEHAMLEAKRENIQEIVADIASAKPVNEVVILSATQQVYASGNSSEIGETRNDKETAQALASGETVTRTKKQYGRNEVSVILPVMSKPECQTHHHSSEAEILGVIEIGLDREPLDALIKKQILIMALIGGFTFVGVGGALALMLRSAVVKPLSSLDSAARRFATGDFGARIQLDKKDEVGRVARTFNEMAEQVEQYALGLENSRRELQERTEQVQRLAAVRGQLLEKLISAQEEERRRIARELHDEAGQALTMIMTNLGRAIDELPGDRAEAKETLSQLRSLAERALEDLRKLIYDLRPEVLDRLGLVPALRSYAKSYLENQNIKVRFHFLGLKHRIPPQVEVTLFRVIQETITNIVRHSGASMVDIQVVATNSAVTATIHDNGKGFDVETALQSPQSWGLRGIQERVAIVGGELRIESTAEQGTRIQVQIPLEGGSSE